MKSPFFMGFFYLLSFGMINLTKVFSSSLDKISRRVVKFLRNGKSDVQTAEESGPYGVDSNPIKNMIAVYARTEQAGQNVLIGYINKGQLAAAGEIRIYSTDEDGWLKTYVWCKNNGDILLGGEADNAVRFSPLDQEMTNLANFINQQLLLIATGIATGGGSYSPGTLTIDISQAKADKIKTP
jgi:hypothetical protein